MVVVGCTKEVPEIAPRVSKDAHLPVWLKARRADESATGAVQPGQHLTEVVDSQKQTNPAGELVPHGRHLLRAVRPSDHESRAAIHGSHHNPALCSAVSRYCRSVLGDDEPERLSEEGDRGVIVVNDERKEFQRHPNTLCNRPWRRHRIQCRPEHFRHPLIGRIDPTNDRQRGLSRKRCFRRSSQ